jgi:RNA polymerase sigma-70 factor (ECF subfamily)
VKEQVLHLNDKILFLVKQQDDKGMKLLFDSYFDMLFHFAKKLTGSIQDSEDIVQTVFIDFWENAKKRDIQDLKSYLFQMTKYQVYAVWSKQPEFSELLEDYKEVISEDNVLSDIMHVELEKEINKAVEGLPDACRNIFKLSRYDGLSHDEIAEKLNLSKQTVKNQLTKATSVLKHQLNVNYALILPGILMFFFSN